ncbi:DUF6443 domain-containing protein [Pedobacter sp. L105]|uniref:DUF6443 domain-containing protein n=1 Tax=Pedobacter sp. L105 TaxID=1641871 RepID=UPI00131AC68E|nr:DUF6443 domain-containing protein [Pedobacter sp. L105]
MSRNLFLSFNRHRYACQSLISRTLVFMSVLLFSFQVKAQSLTPGTITTPSQTIATGSESPRLIATDATGGNGTITYQWESSPEGITWSPIRGANALTYPPPGLTTVTTHYHIIYTSGGATVTSNAVTISVSAAVTPGTVTPASQSIAVGSTAASLTSTAPSGGNGTINCQWQSSTGGATMTNISGANSLTYSFPIHTPTVTTSYQAVYNSNGVTATSNVVTVTVTGTALTAGTVTPSSQTIASGSKADTLKSGSAHGGNSNYTYQWQSSVNGAVMSDISGQTGLTLGFAQGKPAVTTSYQLEAFSNGLTAISNVVTITVSAPPLVAGVITPASFNILAGSSPGTLSASLPTGGNGAYTYKWRTSPDGSSWVNVLTGGDSLKYKVPNLQTTTYYQLQVTSNGAIAYSNTAVVNIGACATFATAPSADQNYILTTIPKIPGYVPGTLYTSCDVKETVDYLDGLGRPLQTVQIKASPLLNDIVQSHVYDGYGREAVKYLPYAEQGGTGTYRSAALTTQGQYYSSSTWDPAVVQTTAPYSQTLFEASPLNRVLQQGSPGMLWQPATSRSTTTGRTILEDYSTNNMDDVPTVTGLEVVMWNAVAVSGSTYKKTLASNGYYAAGQLTVKVIKDENWVNDYSSKSGTSEDYTDKEGRLILRRTFNGPFNGVSVQSTYYVYDDLGNLSFVIPPALNQRMMLSVSQSYLDLYCYQYRYDDRNRLVEKKIPGKGWDYIVYNQLDQPVLNQDSVQRINGQWTFTKYDVLGRNIITGLVGNTSSRSVLETALNAESNFWETPQATPTGYTSVAYPQWENIHAYFSIQYYDDYNFPGATAYPYTSTSISTTGLLTGTSTNVLGTSDMLTSVNYYDNKGRLSKVYKQHYQSGAVNAGNYDEITYSYNFENMDSTMTRIHHNVAGSSTTIANRYVYDQVDRKLSTYEKINTDPEVLLVANSYNEIGQLKAKTLHNGLQSTAYTYNERGWLRNSTSPQFSFQLHYQDDSIPQYNGNISGQVWGAGTSLGSKFVYAYDQQNRLVSGVGTGMSEVIQYDNYQGNILALTRDGVKRSSTYTGNQLISSTGTSTYQYDGNGNTTFDGRMALTYTYNLLNLPIGVTGSGITDVFIYDATGNKLRKTYTSNNGSVVTDYVDGIQYTNGAIEFIQTEAGLARNNSTSYSYEYNLTDHLGNVRYTFHQSPITGLADRLQSDDYYPYGLRKSSGTPVSLTNRYLYNGKEIQDELTTYDYGARFYDPVIGRWNTVDPLAEMYDDQSPYNYGLNNPIKFTDPDGMGVDNQQEDPGKQLKQVNIKAKRKSNIAIPLTEPLSLPKIGIPEFPLPNPVFIFVGLLLRPSNLGDPSSDHVTQKPIVYTKKTPADILNDAIFENETGNGHKQYKKDGGMKQADQDFDDTVVPGTERTIPGGRMGKSSDGMDINVRDHSSSNRVKGGYSGDPTYESKNPNTGVKDKVRYPPK